MPIYVNKDVYDELDAQATNLRAIIQSRAVPDSMLPGLRSTLATLLVTMTDTVPDPLTGNLPAQIARHFREASPTWSPRLDRCRCPDDSGSCDFCMHGPEAA